MAFAAENDQADRRMAAASLRTRVSGIETPDEVGMMKLAHLGVAHLVGKSGGSFQRSHWLLDQSFIMEVHVDRQVIA